MSSKRPKNSTATFEEPGAKAGYCACPLHTTPPKGRAEHLSHPPGLTPGHTPTLTPYKKEACPPSGSEQARAPVVCSRSPAAAGAPIKPCLSCLSGLWSISTVWGRPRTLVGNTRLQAQDYGRIMLLVGVPKLYSHNLQMVPSLKDWYDAICFLLGLR